MEASRACALLATVLVAAVLACLCAEGAEGEVVFLPLDERFTTRDAFVNMALSHTPYTLRSPPLAILPHIREAADIPALQKWVDHALLSPHRRHPAGEADEREMILSSEMYLYGGLIGSRISNWTQAEVEGRLAKLVAYKQQLGDGVKIYASAVIMRIPAYNSGFEDQWYWAYYGRDLFQFSYFMDKYDTLRQPADLATAQSYRSKVPPAVVEDWLWRRSRNFNVTKAIIEQQFLWKKQHNQRLFEKLYVTQDDNAEYGFNIAEAEKLKALVRQYGLEEDIYIYPGADEVGLTMLAQSSVRKEGKSPRIKLVFRDPATINLIPNYEGQPMIQTLEDQIKAAGGSLTNDTEAASVILLVNNFSHQPQTEAPHQPLNRSIAEYAVFDAYLAAAMRNPRVVVGFADNRYSNGADVVLIRYMESQHSSASHIPMSKFAYAGWNTDGNTLGTVISSSLLMALFPAKREESTWFNAQRILEDCSYQAQWRQGLVAYTALAGDDPNLLSRDLPFYEQLSYKVLAEDFRVITRVYGLPWTLDAIYYPWRRAFEIGFRSS
ncbi:uncharacterized protein ACA1_255750 [Acanthamoeba castellanii str. Neff]|uniref:Uncharacterized protein n=1 Tax=Acanthamoeba castellanii (strain ATCC 30010 / Neff) TaxID=1257118 RepID=L8HA84_ACACF|nr:uncharacterized protein ACA1_255750 [Acanthamoeba castellanii str. Neff]ELR22454.1 hypothetical protein ACA1_255750 [Acanthamoeba castellanii str. Neff]